jgi:hypothetical protein
MDFLRGLKLNSAPQANTIVKNIRNSSISINNTDTEKIISFIEELRSSYRDTLNIFILTTSLDRLRNLEAFSEDFFSQFYTDVLDEWKPFGNESIKEIISEFHQETNIDANISTYIFDSVTEITDERLWAYLKYIKIRTILVVDGISILFDENRSIAKLFNDFSIGGCVIINPSNHCPLKDQSLTCKADVFKHLDIYYNDFAAHGLVHIKLKNINDKTELLNSISSIALNHLNLKKRKINGIEYDIMTQTNGFDNLIL